MYKYYITAQNIACIDYTRTIVFFIFIITTIRQFHSTVVDRFQVHFLSLGIPRLFLINTTRSLSTRFLVNVHQPAQKLNISPWD